MIRNLFYHFGAAILVAAYWVVLVVLGLVLHFHLGASGPTVFFCSAIPCLIGLIMIAMVFDIQELIKIKIRSMETE